jgi:hypothetical protein
MKTKTVKKKENVIKGKTLFDHVNEIQCGHNKNYFKDIGEQDKKTWSNYMINRFVSMHPPYIELINELQKYSPQLEPETYHKLLINILPKQKIYSKYIKTSNTKIMSDKAMDILCKNFECSTREIKQYIQLLTGEQLIKILTKYGMSEKEIKEIINE